MTTTKITLRGDETPDQLREIARQLFKQARAERKLRQAGVQPANRYDELSDAGKMRANVYINALAASDGEPLAERNRAHPNYLTWLAKCAHE